MLYYKVKNDCRAILSNKKVFEMAKNELFTFKELFKKSFTKKFFDLFEEINISKKQTFFFFGYRFEKKEI